MERVEKEPVQVIVRCKPNHPNERQLECYVIGNTLIIYPPKSEFEKEKENEKCAPAFCVVFFHSAPRNTIVALILVIFLIDSLFAIVCLRS
jgi:hypothetical protein